MKRAAKKLTLVFLMLLSIVFILTGTLSFFRSNADEAGSGEPVNEEVTVDTSWYELTYSKNALTFRVSANYRRYLDGEVQDLRDLRTLFTQAVKDIVIDNIILAYSDKTLNGGGPAAAVSYVMPTALEIPESIHNMSLQEIEEYVKNRLKEQDEDGNFELGNFLDGDYNSLLDVAISTYVQEKQKEAGEDFKEEEVYTEVQNKIQEVVEETVEDLLTDEDPQKAQEALEQFLPDVAEALEEAKKENPDLEYKFEKKKGGGVAVQFTNGVDDTKKQELEEKFNGSSEPGQGGSGGLVGEHVGKLKDNADKVVSERVDNVKENGGSVSLGLADVVKAFKELKLNGKSVLSKVKNEGYSANTANIRSIIADILKKPSVLANASDEELKNLVKLDVALKTTYGDVNFTLTLGFKDGFGAVRKAMKAVADHIDVVKEDGTYNVTLTTPEIFNTFITKFFNSERVPEKLRKSLFNLTTKTVDEIYNFGHDKAEDYNAVIDYLRGVDFARYFENILDADYLKSWFSSFPLSQAQMDKAINKLCDVLSTLKDADTARIEDLLHKIIPGISDAQIDSAVARLQNFLKNLNWDKMNAEDIRNYLKNGDVNGKMGEYLDKLSGFIGNHEELYQKFIGYIEKAYAHVPESARDKGIVDLYDGLGNFYAGGTLTVHPDGLLDRAKNLLSRFGVESPEIDNIFGAIDRAFQKDTYTLSMKVNVNNTSLRKVEFTDQNGETLMSGLLPAGADIAFYAPSELTVGEKTFKVLGWIVLGEPSADYVETMTDSDVTLFPVTEFTVTPAVTLDGETVEERTVTFDEEKTYLLSATTEGVYASEEYEYQWYRAGAQEVEKLSGQTIELHGVADSGTYFVEVTDPRTGLVVASEEIEFTIEAKELAVNGTWTGAVSDAYTFTYEDEIAVVFEADETTKEYFEGFEVVFTDEKGEPVEDITKANAGKYTATVTFSLEMLKDGFDAENYVLADAENGAVTFTATITIEKKTLTIEGAWSEESYTAEYDGTDHKSEAVFVPSGDDKDYFETTYAYAKGTETVSAFIDAGDYTVKAVIALKAEYSADNYTVEGDKEATIAFTIAKKVLEATGTWNSKDGETYTLVYNGTDQKGEVAFTVDPSIANFVTVALTFKKGNDAVTEIKNVGDYTVEAKITLKAEYAANYELTGSDTATGRIVVNKCAIDLTGVTWGKLTFEVGDANIAATLTGIDDETLALIKIEYKVNGVWVETPPTEIGEYNVKVVAKDTDNYFVDHKPNDAVFKIVKAVVPPVREPQELEIDVVFKLNGTIGANVVKETDGVTYTVTYAVSTTPDIDEDVEVVFKLVPTGDVSKSAAGSYLATLTISVKAEYADKYTIKGATEGQLVKTFSWTVTPKDVEPSNVYTDQPTGVTVTDKDGVLPAGTTMRVEKIDLTATDFDGVQDFKKLVQGYEITFIGANGQTISVTEGNFDVTLPVPAESKSATLAVIYVNGTTYTKIEGTLSSSGTTFTFSTNHFSTYALAEFEAQVTPPGPDVPPAEDEELDTLWLLILLIVALVILIVILVLVLVFLHTVKVNETAEAEEEPVAEATEPAAETETTEESTEESAEGETETAEEPAEEPTEEPAEEPEEPVVEAPIVEEEEAPIVEAPAEEPEEEEFVVEEAAAEAPVEEAPAEDQTIYPGDEGDVIEETVVSVPMASSAPAPSTQTIITVPQPQPQPVFVPFMPPMMPQNTTTYDRSFTARLSQADELVKSHYSALKNELLSYKGVKSRVSWTCDSFNWGWRKLAKLQIKGKSLVMYLAIDPKTVDEKYHCKDVSDVAKYRQVPTKIKVKSLRSLKYAKELIAKLMMEIGLEQEEVETTKYDVPYQTTETLIALGLIKVKTAPMPSFWGMPPEGSDPDDKAD